MTGNDNMAIFKDLAVVPRLSSQETGGLIVLKYSTLFIVKINSRLLVNYFPQNK